MSQEQTDRDQLTAGKGTEIHTHIKVKDLSYLKPGGVRIDTIKAEQKELIPQDEFPSHVFPGLFGKFITESHKSLNFPPDYTGTAILVAVSTAIGKSNAIQVKSQWREYPVLFAGILGGAGANKSHPMQAPFESFSEIDYQNSTQFESEFNAYNDFQTLSKKEREFKEQPLKPKLIKTILHNTTPEAMGQRIADNDRGCAFVIDELAQLLDGMNNYSKGDNTSTFLSIWSGKSTSIDRMSKPVPLFIREPFLNVIGSVQPRVIPRMFPANKTDNGFLQRFLWAYPSKIEKLPINDIEIEADVIKNFNDFIIDFIAENPISQHPETGKNEPHIYYWSPEAKTYFYEWSAKNTALVNENSDSLKGEVISKFDIHFVRITLIMQVMEEGQKGREGQKRQRTNQISLNSVIGANALCEYYLTSALKVVELLTKSIPQDILPEKKLNFYSSLPESFTTSEANIIGDPLEFNIKAVQRFLSDETLFIKVSQGKYKKIIKT